MSRAIFPSRWFVGVLATILANGVFYGAIGYTQQVRTKTAPTEQPAVAAQPAPTAVNQKEKTKTSRRLPLYYARIVSQVQREKIYGIQSKYEAEIQTLEEQLRALVAKRDGEIEGVLTPEQRELLGKFKAEAAQRTAKRNGAKVAAETAPATNPAVPGKKTTGVGGE